LGSALAVGKHLLCLPGTHTKWVILDNGVIREFLTSVTGELFGALRDHSVLVRAESKDEAGARAAFADGIKRFNDFPNVSILHRLFECRSRVLKGELPASHAADFLSGLLIANDVAGALDLFADCVAGDTLHVIGSPPLTLAYTTALEERGLSTLQLDGAAASLAGLVSVHQQLESRSRRAH
jgi:2-dehydro-3-deoxygalactonokinase